MYGQFMWKEFHIYMKKHACDQDFKTPWIISSVFFFIRSGGGWVGGQIPDQPASALPIFSKEKHEFGLVFGLPVTCMGESDYSLYF
jgi:hypothetical protein